MYEHMGITINEQNDIKAFYKDVLGLKEVKTFDLYQDMSEKIFGIRRPVQVMHFSCEDLHLELFLTDKEQKPIYNHICISLQTEMTSSKKQNLWDFLLLRSKENQVTIFYLLKTIPAICLR